jgi:acetylornithine deacetylase/succinyl-diaminopimelate desuccinylase-like protein
LRLAFRQANFLIESALMSIGHTVTFVPSHRARFLTELCDFIRIPSVSVQPKHANDVRHCGEWLAKHLRSVGLENVSLVPTPRHPIVFAQWRKAQGRPTVLIYGHYDVQPVDPVSKWQTPPFEPTIKNNNLYGRGASDDKGQLFCHVKALESYLRTQGRLPVNVICLFEGEEEIGSPNLKAFLEHNKHVLRADAAVISDTRILSPKQPVITYGLRGGLGLELEVRGPEQDLHSGTFGGAIHNPLQVLSELIAKLHDHQGRVTIPGFYNQVRNYSQDARALMAQTAPPDSHILRDARARKGWGERGYSLYERTTIRPALTINGIVGGYSGPGGKAVIPARATAKLSFRLVPNQNPLEVERLFRDYLERTAPATVQLHLRRQSSAHPVLMSQHHPAIKAAQVAYQQGFGASPVFLRSGGTIPIVNMLQEKLGVPVVLMGFALPDDRMHAPNERFYLPNFFKGIATCIYFLGEIGKRLSPHHKSRDLSTRQTTSRGDYDY